MTKQHFKALADALRGVRPDSTASEYELWYAQWREDIDAVAIACRVFSPAFDYDRFIEACGARVQ